MEEETKPVEEAPEQQPGEQQPEEPPPQTPEPSPEAAPPEVTPEPKPKRKKAPKKVPVRREPVQLGVTVDQYFWTSLMQTQRDMERAQRNDRYAKFSIV